MVDNVRFVSDSAELLVQVLHNFVDICARVGITIGEVTPPSRTNGQTEYVFLGLSFRQLCGVTAGPKLGDKLARALVLLSSTEEIAIDWLAVFGVCSFVSYALGIARRESRLGVTHARLWPSIVELWKKWVSTLLTHSFFPTDTPSTATNIVAFSDASGSGWGGVILFRGHTIIVGDTWSRRAASHDINVKETMAARNTLRKILEPSVIDMYIDNTSTIAWLRKKRSRVYLANAVVEEIFTTLPANVTVRSVSYVKSADNVADGPSRAT
jgi:hypothetical protein